MTNGGQNVEDTMRRARAETGREVNYNPAFVFVQVLVGGKWKIFPKKLLEKNLQEDDIHISSCSFKNTSFPCPVCDSQQSLNRN